MKKAWYALALLAWAALLPSLAAAEVNVNVNLGIPLPPPFVFPAPPQVAVIPETYVYAVPDVDVDIFFYGGWWWRPWEGRWYRSPHYDRGWVYYDRVPSFYRHVPPGWRKYYHDPGWQGYAWKQHRIPYRDMEKNWRNWEKRKHWEKRDYWGLKAPAASKGPPKAHHPQKYKDKSRVPPPQEKHVRDSRHGPKREGPPPHQGKHTGKGDKGKKGGRD